MVGGARQAAWCERRRAAGGRGSAAGGGRGGGGAVEEAGWRPDDDEKAQGGDGGRAARPEWRRQLGTGKSPSRATMERFEGWGSFRSPTLTFTGWEDV